MSVSESFCFHSTNLNGPVPTALVGSEAVVGSAMFRNSKKSKASGRGLSDLNMTVYLSGISIEVHHLASSSWVFGRSRARAIALHGVGVQLGAVVEQDTLAEVELDRHEVRRDVPALRQHGLDVVIDVVLGQTIVDGVIDVTESEMGVQSIDVDVGAEA